MGSVCALGIMSTRTTKECLEKCLSTGYHAYENSGKQEGSHRTPIGELWPIFEVKQSENLFLARRLMPLALFVTSWVVLQLFRESAPEESASSRDWFCTVLSYALGIGGSLLIDGIVYDKMCLRLQLHHGVVPNGGGADSTCISGMQDRDSALRFKEHHWWNSLLQAVQERRLTDPDMKDQSSSV